MLGRSMMILSALLVSACSSLDTTMSASSDINPDMNGNPSPIAVSIFELSDSSAFIAADFVHLYAEPAGTLGTSLLAERNIMLVPGTTQIVSVPVVKGVKSIAYVAAYQNLANSNWRELVSVMPNMIQGADIVLTLDNQGIHLISNKKSL